MSTKTILVCDRCGAEAEKWKGPMVGGQEMRVVGWYTEDRDSGVFAKKIARDPKQITLCDSCMRAHDEFMAVYQGRLKSE